MSEVSQDPISCKTILVGDSGVGKTSIIGRYLNKFNENQQATIGASFSNKLENIDGNEILFEIWDTAGQERYRSVNTLFYQDAYICILVYDITSKKSFESLRNYWYDAVKENGNNGLIFHVAGNKNDLYENEDVDRKVVEDYCYSINAGLNFVSATENSTCIDDMFQSLGKKFIQSDIYENMMASKRMTQKLSLKEVENNEKIKKKKKFC
jgi:small GTP-binding protein